MALSQKSLRNKREKKQKKRKLATAKSNGLANTSGVHWPIYECLVAKDLWENGIGHVVVARKNDLNEVVAGIFLLDVFCLGVKDCFLRYGTLQEYRQLLEKASAACGELEPVEAPYAATLINSMVHYAKKLSFQPHHSFGKVVKLLKGIPLDTTLIFSFGKDNKPYYHQGPHESPSDGKRILKTLDAKCGRGGYHFTVELRDEDRFENVFEEA